MGIISNIRESKGFKFIADISVVHWVITVILIPSVIGAWVWLARPKPNTNPVAPVQTQTTAANSTNGTSSASANPKVKTQTPSIKGKNSPHRVNKKIENAQAPEPPKPAAISISGGPVLLDHNWIEGGGIRVEKRAQPLQGMPNDLQGAQITSNRISDVNAALENSGKVEGGEVSGNIVRPSPGGSAKAVKNNPGGELKNVPITNNDVGPSPAPPQSEKQ